MDPVVEVVDGDEEDVRFGLLGLRGTGEGEDEGEQGEEFLGEFHRRGRLEADELWRTIDARQNAIIA
jgi:hypothetical protein